LESQRQVPTQNEDWQRRLEIYKFLEISAQNPAQVKEAFQEIARVATSKQATNNR